MPSKKQIELILAAQNRTNKSFDQVNKNISKLERNVQNIKKLGNIFAGLFAVNQITGYAQDLAKITDEWKNIEARLRLVTRDSEELTQVQDDLFKLSQKTATSYKTTAELYASVARNAEGLNLSNQKLLNLTEVINKSTQVSGASTQAAEAAITQLNQALASGVLRGDEFNSVMEQAPRLAQAIADGLGVPIGALRNMAKEGELTAERVTQALLDQKNTIEKEFLELPETVGRAVTKLNNEWERFVSQLDSATGINEGAADSINGIAKAFNAVTNQVDRFADALDVASSYGDKIKDALIKAIPGGDFIKSYIEFENIQSEIVKQTEEQTKKTEELTEATDDLTESEYALIYAQEQEQALLDAKQKKVDDVLSSLQEESNLLKLSAKDQYIYNQVKKAGADITEEQAEAIREAAGALFDEREAIRSAKNETQQLRLETADYSREVREINQGISSLGKAKDDTKGLTEETKNLTAATRDWLSATSQPGTDTSDSFFKITPEQAKEEGKKIATAYQSGINEVQPEIKVKFPQSSKIIQSSSFSTQGGLDSGLSSVSFAKEALKQGSKAS